MFENFPSEIIVIPALFIALPWLILHYVTKWKTASTLTNDDEALLDDLYQLSRRLEDRMETVERLVAADNPDGSQGYAQAGGRRPRIPAARRRHPGAPGRRRLSSSFR